MKRRWEVKERVEGNQKSGRKRGKKERKEGGGRERERERERESVVKPTTLMGLESYYPCKSSSAPISLRSLTLSPNVGHSIVAQSSLHGCQWGLPSGWSATAAEDTGQPSASHPQLCHCMCREYMDLSILGLHISVYYSV